MWFIHKAVVLHDIYNLVLFKNMPWINCIICSNNFYAKPRHIKVGWGKYCSKECQYKAQHTGKIVKCSNCGRSIYRQQSALQQSKSKKFFCDKSCLASWKNRNILYGEKSANWRNGAGSYRAIMSRAKVKPICSMCQQDDKRVLVVHHIDGNRQNNSLKNLIWVCRNCHCLIHVHNQKINK